MDEILIDLNMLSKLGYAVWKIRHMTTFKSVTGFLSLVLIVAAIPATVFMLRSNSFLGLNASSTGVKLLVSPGSANLPPDAPFLIVMDSADNKIGFVRFVIKFDQTKIQLTGDIETAAELKTVITKTGYVQANQTGKAEIVLGLAPSDVSPTGSIQLAKFTVRSVSLVDNDSTIISIDPTDVQVVNLDVVSLTGVVQSAVVSLNPKVATPIPTVTPAPTVVPTLVPTISPTSTPDQPNSTLLPTSIPSPTDIPKQTAEPTTEPSTSTQTSATPTPLPTLAPQDFGQASPTPAPTAVADTSNTGSGSSSGSSSSDNSSSGSASSSASGKKGDLNGDGKVNILDLSVMLSSFGKTGGSADLNADGRVTILDLSILLSRWGK